MGKFYKVLLGCGTVLTVSEKNINDYGELDKCDEDGIDFELLSFDGDSHETLFSLEPEGSYVTIQIYDVESENSSGPLYGSSMWFNFVGTEIRDFPEHIKKKYHLREFSKEDQGCVFSEMIYFIDDKPITNPEIFTEDENLIEEITWTEHILEFEEVDWENLSKYL